MKGLNLKNILTLFIGGMAGGVTALVVNSLLRGYGYQFDLSTFVNHCVTLAATFIGAWAAFKLQITREENKSAEDNVKEIKKIQFVLISQRNKLLNIKAKLLDQYKDSNFRWLQLPAAHPLVINNLNIDCEKIDFLLSEDPNLIFDIQLSDHEFISCVDTLDRRSALHISKLQPILEKINNNRNSGNEDDEHFFNAAEISSALGARFTQMIKQLTDDCYTGIDDYLAHNKKVLDQLELVAKRLYPKFKFLKLIDGDK